MDIRESSGSSMCKECNLFYGAQAFGGLCSTCHRKSHRQEKKEETKVQLKKEPLTRKDNPDSVLSFKDIPNIKASQQLPSLKESMFKSDQPLEKHHFSTETAREQQPPSKSEVASECSQPTCQSIGLTSVEIIPPVESAPESAPAPKADPSRCFNCTRKVGLLGIECKCGQVFCNRHRMPEDHACSFDFKSQAQEKLKKEVVKAVHQKIVEI